MEVPEWEETDVMACSTTRESAWMVCHCSSREDKWRQVNNANKLKVWVVLWVAWEACKAACKEEWVVVRVVSAAKMVVWAAMVVAGEALGAPIQNRYFDNQTDFKQ